MVAYRNKYILLLLNFHFFEEVSYSIRVTSNITTANLSSAGNLHGNPNFNIFIMWHVLCKPLLV